jgi:hypothetical protein
MIRKSGSRFSEKIMPHQKAGAAIASIGSDCRPGMIRKSGSRFPAFAKPASAGEGRSEKIMPHQKAGACGRLGNARHPSPGGQASACRTDERSEIRDRRVQASLPLPDFAHAHPGSFLDPAIARVSQMKEVKSGIGACGFVAASLFHIVHLGYLPAPSAHRKRTRHLAGISLNHA